MHPACVPSRPLLVGRRFQELPINHDVLGNTGSVSLPSDTYIAATALWAVPL